MKWSVEKRLSELERCTIDCSLAIHKFGNNAEMNNFTKLCESLSDFETMLEVCEETFPTLRFKMDEIKKAKLTVLKKQGEATKFEEKAQAIKDQAIKIDEIIKKQVTDNSKSKGLRKLFR